jgi:hypothetical protein
MESHVEMILTGKKLKNLEKACASATFSTSNPYMG